MIAHNVRHGLLCGNVNTRRKHCMNLNYTNVRDAKIVGQHLSQSIIYHNVYGVHGRLVSSGTGMARYLTTEPMYQCSASVCGIWFSDREGIKAVVVPDAGAEMRTHMVMAVMSAAHSLSSCEIGFCSSGRAL